MNPYVIALICIVFVAAVAAGLYFVMRNRKSNVITDKNEKGAIITKNNTELADTEKEKMIIRFENLPSLTEEEESRLVEVNDNKLLARIDGAIPGTLQAVANAGAIHSYQKAIQSAGQLYQAVIPKGAVLSNSTTLEGAVRGFYRGADNIKGHANFVPVDGNMGGGLAAMNVANAAMGVASMVVGQYYMTQINDQLDSITDSMDKITSFQDNEYKSKVYALVAEIQKSSIFQVETIENEELRKRELDHLKNLEHECAELLGQANLTLQDYAKKSGLDYEKYEKYVGEADSWYKHQQILLEIMGKIGGLTYALNLGAVSKDNCYAMFLPYAKQAEKSLKQLNDWHKENGLKLEIDMESNRRKKQGIEGFIMNIPAFFNEDYKYKPISDQTAEMISRQILGTAEVKPTDDKELFKEDVRLVAKEGKLYYLPSTYSEKGNHNVFESEFAKIEYIAKDNAVFHIWKKEAHFDDYRNLVSASLEMLREHKGSLFIVDASNGFEDVPEDVEWGFQYFLPELKKTGCRIWGFILPEVSDIEGEINLWTAEIEKNFTVIRAISYDDIIEKAKEI